MTRRKDIIKLITVIDQAVNYRQQRIATPINGFFERFKGCFGRRFNRNQNKFIIHPFYTKVGMIVPICKSFVQKFLHCFMVFYGKKKVSSLKFCHFCSFSCMDTRDSRPPISGGLENTGGQQQ